MQQAVFFIIFMLNIGISIYLKFHFYFYNICQKKTMNILKTREKNTVFHYAFLLSKFFYIQNKIFLIKYHQHIYMPLYYF